MSKEPIDWARVLGPLMSADHAASLSQAVAQRAIRSCRPRNQDIAQQLPFAIKPVPWFPRAGSLLDRQLRPGRILNHFAGDYYIQDAGSLLAVALCDLAPGQLVCDTCAAPGGKSTAILEELDGHGFLLANEAVASRIDPLRNAIWRTGLANHLVCNSDIELLSTQMQGQFDRVLVDAPCTGQSMVARGKQSLAAFSAAQIEHSAARQRRILQAAIKLVAPGGKLIYSTCTYAYAENEAIIGSLLADHPEYSADRRDDLQAWENTDAPGCYRVWPNEELSEGAFAAAIVRNHAAVPLPAAARSRSREKSRRGAKSRKWLSLAGPPDEVTQWFTAATLESLTEKYLWYQTGDLLQLVPLAAAQYLATTELASQAVCSVPVAVAKAARWEPTYASSLLSSKILAAKKRVELDDAQACLFATGHPIRLVDQLPDSSSSTSAWHQVCWRGRMLAWGKLTGQTLKNHVPKAIRPANLVPPPSFG